MTNIVFSLVITALGHVESNNNNDAIGALGERGQWQWTRRAWDEERKMARGHFSVGPWRTAAHDEFEARLLVCHRVDRLAQMLYGATGRRAEVADVVCMWQMGFTGYRRIRFNPAKAPASVRSAIKRAEAFIRKRAAM